MRKIITILSIPLLAVHIIVRYTSPQKRIMKDDLIQNILYRHSPFKSNFLRFLYYILWLPEYRSLFYKRAGFAGHLMNLYLPGCSSLFIRTHAMGGVLYSIMHIQQRSMQLVWVKIV